MTVPSVNARAPVAERTLYAGELVGQLSKDPLERYAAAMTADPRVKDHLGQCLLADQRFYLPADMLMKVDALSMAHSLEVRLPFLDPRVLELSAQLETALLSPALVRSVDDRGIVFAAANSPIS